MLCPGCVIPHEFTQRQVIIHLHLGGKLNAVYSSSLTTVSIFFTGKATQSTTFTILRGMVCLLLLPFSNHITMSECSKMDEKRLLIIGIKVFPHAMIESWDKGIAVAHSLCHALLLNNGPDSSSLYPCWHRLY